VGVFNDRLCIASNGEFTAELSTADMTACDRDNNGCNGGNPANAVRWAMRKGVVTGGDFQTEEMARLVIHTQL
jgi:cathepsin B